jgi:hypothetical protein
MFDIGLLIDQERTIAEGWKISTPEPRSEEEAKVVFLVAKCHIFFVGSMVCGV